MLIAALVLCGAPLAHGTWVYHRSGLDDQRIARLAESRTRAGMTELYVSVAALPPDATTTPKKVRALKQAGLRVEALIDGPNPVPHIARVLAYNRAQADNASRFDGIHYDFEPWIGSGQSVLWADQLTSSYQRVREALSGLPLSVDISGVKLLQLPPATRALLRQATPRIVLMQYEATSDKVTSRSEAFLRDEPSSELHADKGASIMVALRQKDFGCGVLDELDRLEKQWSALPRYAGWALFEYDDYADKCLGAAKPAKSKTN